MEIKRYFAIVRRWWWLLVLAVVIAAAVSFIYSWRLPRLYSASTTLMVGQVLTTANPQAGDIAISQNLAQTYAQLVRRQPVLQATVDELGLGVPWAALAGQVNGIALPNTQLLQITVIADDPQRAVVIADEVARQVIKVSPTPQEQAEVQRRDFVGGQLQDLQSRITDAQNQIKALQDRLAGESSARNVQDLQSQISALQGQVASWQTSYAGLVASQTGGTNNLSVVDPATSSGAPVSPNLMLNVLVAAGVGLGLAICGVLALEYMDDSLRSKDDVERVLQLPTLGSIGRARSKQKGLLDATNLGSPAAEAYRSLRTNVLLATEGPGILLIASPSPGEGKTTIAANLAIIMAQTGQRVLLCDTDLRRPGSHRLFGVPNEIGLTSLLGDPMLPISAAVSQTDVPGLMLLPSGPLPGNPSELLGSMLMKQRIFEMEQLADVVILDSPALLAVNDTAVLAMLCSDALLVVDAGHTRSGPARRAKALLESCGVAISGVVLNGASEPLSRSYYAYYSSLPTTSGQPVIDIDWRARHKEPRNQILRWHG